MSVTRSIAFASGLAIAVASVASPHQIALRLGGVATTPAPMPSATLSPDEIYTRSVREMRTLARTGEPPYLIFDLKLDSHNLHWYPQTDNGLTDWEVKLVHANETHTYRIWYRSKDERALVQDAVSHAAYTGESPFVPETTDFSEMSESKTTPSPTPSPSTGDARKAPAQVIGAITVNGSRYYAIDLVGIEPHDGRQTYHLHLRAYRNAMDYPLTDLWVDTNDFRIVGAHGEVTIRAVAALLGVGVTADFSEFDKYWLVSTIDFTMKGYIAFWHANTETSLKASVVSAPAMIQDSYFGAPPSPRPSHT